MISFNGFYSAILMRSTHHHWEWCSIQCAYNYNTPTAETNWKTGRNCTVLCSIQIHSRSVQLNINQMSETRTNFVLPYSCVPLLLFFCIWSRDAHINIPWAAQRLSNVTEIFARTKGKQQANKKKMIRSRRKGEKQQKKTHE